MAEKLTYAKETKPKRWRQNSTDDQKQSDPPLHVDVRENEQEFLYEQGILISDQEQYDLPEYQHPENLPLHNDVLENEHECPYEQETEADTNSINVISSILNLRQLRKVLSAIFLDVLKNAIPLDPPGYQVIIQDSINKWALQGQRGIVYCATPGECETLKLGLEQIGMTVSIFHGKLPSDEKKLEYLHWKEQKHDIMVATTAFGLGIDEPDIRFVIHVKLPTSMSTFLQESGRAGRDGNAAKSLLVTSIGLQKRTAYNIIGDGNLPDKHRSLKEMEVYLINSSTCRRSFHERCLTSHATDKQLPALFCLSDAFQSLYPESTPCDICATSDSYHISQMHIGLQVVKLVELAKEVEPQLSELELTPELLRDIFCQVKRSGKPVLADAVMKHLVTWEKGKLDKETVDEIIGRMIWQGILVETISSMEKRFTSHVSAAAGAIHVPEILEYCVKRIRKR